MKINTKFSTINISSEIQKVLIDVLKDFQNRKTFVLVDENTKTHCLPVIANIDQIKSSELIEIESGEKNKNVKSLEKIWTIFTKKGADRTSLLINLGGGIIGDLGGLAASTFKRGIDFINIPTTLLSQVDASVGGKTGINFLGLKNEIGVFNHPKYVIIDSSFNRTLDKRNILSGWTEMLKHAIIFDEKDWQNLISYDIKQTGFDELNQLIARSVSIKNYFVEKDPIENDIRKALNFGHTFGHAFESLFMNTENEILHGEAVTHGIICELYLSGRICNFPRKKIDDVVSYLLKTYNKLKFKDSDLEKIIDLTGHDKKNEGININFTLLEDFGKIKINQNCDREIITETLNWYRNL
ncbi:MAG: 3-dehydroquinate synthase [Bacteroidales bacterium]|nr:3-dehydroquinate synthase [Bacteroidales bacterium]